MNRVDRVVTPNHIHIVMRLNEVDGLRIGLAKPQLLAAFLYQYPVC
jgi:hypothetical protein